jgi:hypothetical protein
MKLKKNATLVILKGRSKQCHPGRLREQAKEIFFFSSRQECVLLLLFRFSSLDIP